jgi:hypothetical protein
LVEVAQFTWAFAPTQAKHPIEMKIILRATFIICSLWLRYFLAFRIAMTISFN